MEGAWKKMLKRCLKDGKLVNTMMEHDKEEWENSTLVGSVVLKKFKSMQTTLKRINLIMKEMTSGIHKSRVTWEFNNNNINNRDEG